VRAIVVPPPQMVARMRAGDMDGFCAGEPWNARAIADGVGFTAITSQGIWRDHPEKVLGTTLEFVGRYPNTTRALIAAVLEASRYVDARGNRERVAAVIGDARYVDAPPALIAGRLRGDYQDGRGRRWQDPDCIRFFAGGEVNFPYPSHGMWFLSQLRRWGLLRQEIDYRALAERVNQTALYSEVARALHVAVPETSLKTETLFDGRVFDPSRIADYISGFDIKS
jgi:nitrate/nitrite transport system substrate-binding protein